MPNNNKERKSIAEVIKGLAMLAILGFWPLLFILCLGAFIYTLFQRVLAGDWATIFSWLIWPTSLGASIWLAVVVGRLLAKSRWGPKLSNFAESMCTVVLVICMATVVVASCKGGGFYNSCVPSRYINCD